LFVKRYNVFIFASLVIIAGIQRVYVMYHTISPIPSWCLYDCVGWSTAPTHTPIHSHTPTPTHSHTHAHSYTHL